MTFFFQDLKFGFKVGDSYFFPIYNEGIVLLRLNGCKIYLQLKGQRRDPM